jgi:hypothetical protein
MNVISPTVSRATVVNGGVFQKGALARDYLLSAWRFAVRFVSQSGSISGTDESSNSV